MYGYIYKTTNLVNNKIYIGKKKGEFAEQYKGSGKYLRNALKKYGEDCFIVEILEWCETLQIQNDQEQYWIEYYRSLNVPMYNIANGGDGGDTYANLSEEDRNMMLLRKKEASKNNHIKYKENYKQGHIKAWETRRKNGNDVFSDEYRKKLSDAHKGHKQSIETRKKISEAFRGEKHPLFGTHRSEETKLKISASSKGKKASEETKAKLRITNSGVNNGFYGKTHSQETKQMLGQKSKEWFSSHEIIWINNGVVNTRIDAVDFEKYEKLGYKRGRVKWRQNR